MEIDQDSFVEVIHHPRHEIDEIIERRLLEILFQPIIDLSKARILGYEALSRGPGNSEFNNPVQLFEAAERAGRLYEMESLCQELAYKHFSQRGLQGRLFVNVSPMFLLQCERSSVNLHDQLRRYDLDPHNVVIEVSEKYPFDDSDIINASLERYRKVGFHIAIDDLGAGYAGLRIWSELRPDYVKMDSHFSHAIHDDPLKREFVRSIKGISRTLNCEVIAEGVETDEELDAVRSTGVCLIQGFLLGRPKQKPQSINCDNLRLNQTSLDTHISWVNTENISQMVEQTPVLNRNDLLERAADMFQQNRELVSIPVLYRKRPVGIVTRSKVMEIFLGRYGRELHARKPVSEFMSPAIIVDCETSLDEVSQIVTDHDDNDFNVDFIITRDRRYLGVGKIRKLLKRITDKQMRSARYSNPLTQLPGNVPIYEWIDDLLANRSNFHIAYFDINNFKPYNDIYGYSRGDEVIVMLAEILCEHVNCGENLVGHIGGDDFVVIFRGNDWYERCAQILECFRAKVDRFYNDEDNASGGIWSHDRNGDQTFFEKIDLAIGVVRPDPKRCHSHHDIAMLAADAKSHAKRSGNNDIFVSRRRGPSKMTHLEKIKSA